MYDHIGIKVKDLQTAIRFYKAALGDLGYQLCSSDESGAGFGPKGTPALWLYADKHAGGGVHIAFRVRSHAAVDGFHDAGVKAGGKDNGKAGLRKDYGPTYYAAFLIDPDGNNVEAVCMS